MEGVKKTALAQFFIPKLDWSNGILPDCNTIYFYYYYNLKPTGFKPYLNMDWMCLNLVPW
jgi:hypothetical protein